MITIKIGKAPDNDMVIDEPYISRYHAQLTINADGEYYIEDLDSGNGTFVNDRQIHRKKVSIHDKIILGEKYELSLQNILNSRNNYKEEFDSLKSVYEKYQAEKVRIQSTNQFKTRILQSLPFALPGIIGVTLGINGVANKNILYISLLITIIAPVCGVIMGARQSAKTPGQLQALADNFKIRYVCPKCGTFLGEIPWQSLKNRGKCPNSSCKATWE